MAALFLKSLLTPKEKCDKYRPLRPNSPLDKMERGSTDSGIAMSSDELYSEKTNTVNSVTSLPARINPRLISDATIGLSDGLTVPFALTAGLSALGDTNVVIYGGFAELIAGGISMGLGGYLGAKSEAEAYHAALAETRAIVADDHRKACQMVRSTFDTYDFEDAAMDSVTSSLLASPHQMVDFIMRFHHQLTEADYAPARAYVSGLTIALGYILGGMVALLPYLFLDTIQQGFAGSVIVMGLALFIFGWVKTSLVGERQRWVCFKSGMQMTVLGGVAAGAAVGCVKAIGS